MKMRRILHSKWFVKVLFHDEMSFFNVISFARFCSSYFQLSRLFRVVPTSPDNQGSTILSKFTEIFLKLVVSWLQKSLMTKNSNIIRKKSTELIFEARQDLQWIEPPMFKWGEIELDTNSNQGVAQLSY